MSVVYEPKYGELSFSCYQGRIYVNWCLRTQEECDKLTERFEREYPFMCIRKAEQRTIWIDRMTPSGRVYFSQTGVFDPFYLSKFIK
jgi:hypothetical protein